MSEQTNAERTERWPEGRGSLTNSFFFPLEKVVVYCIKGWTKITTSVMFSSLSLSYTFSHYSLSLSSLCTVTLCLSFTRSL